MHSILNILKVLNKSYKNSSPVLFQSDLLNKKAWPPYMLGCRNKTKLYQYNKVNYNEILRSVLMYSPNLHSNPK